MSLLVLIQVAMRSSQLSTRLLSLIRCVFGSAKSIIFSPDGDLQIYPYADESPVRQRLKLALLFQITQILTVSNHFLSAYAEGNESRVGHGQGDGHDEIDSVESSWISAAGRTAVRC